MLCIILSQETVSGYVKILLAARPRGHKQGRGFTVARVMKVGRAVRVGGVGRAMRVATVDSVGGVGKVLQVARVTEVVRLARVATMALTGG